MVSMHRSQRTGRLIWPTIRASTSRPSWTTRPSLFEMTAVRGSWVETDRASMPRWPTAGAMWLGVEGAGDAQRDQPGAGRRVGGERLELLGGARGDDLAGAVVVGGGQAVLVEGGQHLVAVAAEDGGHPGRRDGGRVGHRPAALADEDHRLLGAEHPGAGGGGQLTDAVTGNRPDLREPVGGVGEQLEGGDQAGGDQQRLGDPGVADGLGVGLRCRSGPGPARPRRRARPDARRRCGPRARAGGSRGSGRPDRERR